ncbi:MAG: MGMT family protein [Patescibacteria group bacterium]
MSEFVRKVHQVVKAIKPGKVMNYREVAEAAGSPRAWRAVGRIMARNHDPHIPCHRVVRSAGRTGGYNRGGERVKQELLEQEKRTGKTALGALEAMQQRLAGGD